MYYTVQGNTAIIYNNFKWNIGNSLVDQWLLGLCAFTAKGMGSIPGQGTKILQAM